MTDHTKTISTVMVALDLGKLKYGMITMNGAGGQRAAIMFDVSWREIGYCWKCGKVLEDKRYKECVSCRK